ncbi:MAG: hypothetical protein ABSF70_06310 [Terracidiphilus sp.]
MRIAGRRVSFFLNDEGKQFLHEVVSVDTLEPFTVEVEDSSDDIGIWVRVERGSHINVLLLRWEFILGIELPLDTGNVVGLRG